MSKKILLADDSVTIQKVISITFSSEDYELTVVGDGDAAIKKAKEERPDLVLADVAMPGKNGYEVSEALKKDPATSAIPVMLLAGTFEPLDKNEAERVKADESIVKPFESQELLDKVRNLLARSEKAGAAPPEGAGARVGGPDEIWEPGDFTGFTEEPEFKEQEAPDLSFLEGGLFEETTKELSSPHDDFTDLEFHEEDFKVSKESATAPPPPPEQKAASYEPPTSENFDIVEPFEFKAAETKEETFDIPSFEAEPAGVEPAAPEAPKKPFWAETAREAEAVKAPEPAAEPDLLEFPQGEITEEAVEFVEAAEEKPPFKPHTEAAPAVSGAAVTEAAEKAATGAVLKLEERFRSDLDARLKGAEGEIARAIEKTAAKVEAGLKDDIGAKLEKSLSIPKEEVAEIVRKTAKEVIEEVAWEVIPELAEELIKAEINRIKEAIIRAK